MPINDNPIEPLQRSLQSVFRRLVDTRLLLPFLLLALAKAAVLISVARLDVLPARLVAALLWVYPPLAEQLHYPETLHNLPELARWLDRAVFVSLGALLHGWAIVYLARVWTQRPLLLFPRLGRGLVRLAGLLFVAAAILVIPFAVQWLAVRLAPSVATFAALGTGFVVQILLFTAPVFLVVESRSLWRSVCLSVDLVSEFPVALPLAVLVLAAVHAPVLLLRMPLFSTSLHHDPDWILYFILAQIAVDVFAALLAAGLAARFALTYRSWRQSG
jgi:hypothetical protein